MRPVATLKAAALGAALFASGAALAQTPTQTLSGVISANRTLDAAQVYLIDGEVYVDNNVTLTIPAGTLLKGKRTPTTGNGNASVLVVQRGGQLVANGTAAAPIIFTAETDNVADAFDLNENQRGLWGGVVILGNATANNGTGTIEGIPATARTTYGCGDAGFPCDDNDNSGTLRYVSVRHAGFTLGANAEINGVTFGGVGRGTTVEYVEVFANSDDSFEFFGGTVNARYLVGVFGGDDDLDWDVGYRGRIQFVLSVKDDAGDVGRCIEGDGALTPFTPTPLSSPVVSNLTCIGSGVTGTAPAGSDAGGPSMTLRDNTGGFIYNSVFTAVQNPRGGLDLEAPADANVSTRVNFDQGELDVRNNIFFDFSAGNTPAGIVNGSDTALETEIAARNTIVSPGLRAISRQQNRGLDPRPTSDAAAASGANFSYAPIQGSIFTPVAFRGAFAPGQPAWAAGWTALDRNAYFSAQVAVEAEAGPLAAAGFRIAATPNPATSGRAALTVEVPETTDARIAVYDVLGREVAVVAERTLAAGTQTFAIGRMLPAGVYVARLTTAQGMTAVQFTVVR